MSSLLNNRHLIPLLHSSRIYITILSIFCLALFILGMGGWDLWKPDEPRYAQVAQEMVRRGDWISMHLNGQPYFDKPPLFFWLIAISAYLWGGITSFSARFPSGIFGSLTILVTFFLGKRLYDPRTGFLSGLILATSFEFMNYSTKANLDATLTFFITGSLYCFLRWQDWENRKNERQGRSRSLIIYGFYIGMALATLTKGPVGFLIPLLVSLVYLLIQKDWKGIRRMKLLTGMLLFSAIVLSWYLPALWRGGQDYLNATLSIHTIDRYAKGWSHAEPAYYYLLVFPFGFLPWIFFLPKAIASEFSKRKEGLPKEFLFLLVWFVTAFLFFSFSKGKRSNYILPLYPAVSILVGNFWNTYLSGDHRNFIRKTWNLPIYLLITLFFFLGLVFFWISVAPKPLTESSIFRIMAGIVKLTGVRAKELPYISHKMFIPFAFFFLGSSIFVFFSHKRRYKLVLFLSIVITVGIGFFYRARFINPSINPFRSTRYISQEIQQTMGSGGRLAIYGFIPTYPYNFYTGIVPILKIEDEGGLRKYFSSAERVFCILRYEDYAKLMAKDMGIPFRLIIQRVVDHDAMVLVSNQ